MADINNSKLLQINAGILKKNACVVIVRTEWNAAIVYATTAAYFATRLAGAPKVSPGNAPVQVLTTPQVQELQRLLIQQRLLTGEADGRLGSQTRVAVKKAQLKVGLPADSYPSVELIERLRGGR